MKTLGLALAAVVIGLGALLMVDSIMSSLGTILFALPVFKGLVGFIFVIVSGYMLGQVQGKKE